MRSRVVLSLIVFAGVLSMMACNLAELSSVVDNQATTDVWVGEPVAVTATAAAVEVTTEPVDAQPQYDIEERLVIDIYSKVGPAVVCVTAPQRFGECIGSGFVIDLEGHIVTNNHVAEAADELLVTLADEHTVAAEVMGSDPGSDLAVLKIDVSPEKLAVADLGESDTLQVGQRAIAIGNPFGLERSVTTGVISSLERTLSRDDSRFQIAEVIQTDAAINPGNSGGPLLDSHGRVIGVNSAIGSETGTNSGVGFAIPVDIVKRVVPELINNGRYRHPWLGISGGSISPDMLEAAELPVSTGVLIFEVEPGSPADEAGLLGGDEPVSMSGVPMMAGGDIVVAIDLVDVQRFADIVNYLATETSVGDSVTLAVIREGREIEISAILAERPGSLR